jgi:hypothetical protein
MPEPKVVSIFSGKAVELCPECPKEYKVSQATVAHSNQHFPGAKIVDIRDAQKYARSDRGTSVFADGTKLEEILEKINSPESKVAFNKKAGEMLASGSEKVAFDVEMTIETPAGPKKQKVRVVVCIKISCADDMERTATGQPVIKKDAFKQGEIISIFPDCGPEVITIPTLSEVQVSVANFKAGSPWGTGKGKVRVKLCD